MTMRSIVLAATALLVAGTAAHAQAPSQIRIGGSGVGGTFYVFASAMAALIDKHMAPLTATALPAAGTAENVRKLRQNQIDFAVAVPDAAYYAQRGTGPFARDGGYPELRAVTNIYDAPFMITTLQRSPIRGIADIKGKRLAVGNPGGLEHFYADVVLKAYGLGLKDVSPVPMAIGDRGKAIGDGNVDASVFLVGVTSAVVTEMTTLHDVRFVPLTADALAKITAEHPYYQSSAIPAGTFKGQDAAVPAIYVVNLVMARGDLPADMVYKLTKLMFEQKAELTAMQPLAAALDPTKGCIGTPIPLHPGAERFFRESGCLR